MLRDEGPLTPMAGCTDLYVVLNFGTLADTRFLNLWPLESLRRIEARGDRLSIGALATHSDIIRSPLVRTRIPMLAAASREVGGVQIQNRGTLGGNVANASPAGDTLPVLAAADAVVVLQSAGGTRRVPFTGFYTGYRQSVRRSDELVAALEVPRLRGRQWFRKVGTRAAQAISKVVIAGVGDGNMTQAALDRLTEAAKNGVVVVRSTRLPQVIVLRNNEVDDDKLGFVASGELCPAKARLLLQLALTKTSDVREIQKMFYTY